MKTSELIQHLCREISVHGDCNVTVNTPDAAYEVTRPLFLSREEVTDGPVVCIMTGEVVDHE